MIERVGVVGAGTMGAGIAQLACQAGCETFLFDLDDAALEKGAVALRAALDRGADRGRWSPADAQAAAGRLHTVSDLEALAGCDAVIEAAPERLELKQDLFASLEAIAGPAVILASNTSSLSVTGIAANCERPQNVCGMHFFNPPPAMRLVEVVAGTESSAETLEAISDLARRMGREPVAAADAIGFIGNRVNRPFSLEGLRLAGERITFFDQIDRIVRIGGGYRMGPFELMDLVGIDVNLSVARSFYEQSFGEPRWRPHPLQSRMVDAGTLGRKTGRGWYSYDNGPHRPEDPPPIERPDPLPTYATAPDGSIVGEGFRAIPLEEGSLHELAEGAGDVGFVALPTLEDAVVVEINALPSTTYEALASAGRFFVQIGKHVECVPGDAPGLVLGRIVCQLINEASFAVAEGVASPDDVDTAMRLGFNHPRGPLAWREAIGSERVAAILDALHRELGEERYRVSPELRRGC